MSQLKTAGERLKALIPAKLGMLFSIHIRLVGL